MRVSYTNNGAPAIIEADYCVCTMPLVVLRKIPNDLSAPYKKVVDECTYAAPFKVAWESRRFWEQDYNIYGGLEFCRVGLSPIWLPSAGMFSERGVLVSGYGYDTTPEFTFQQKLAESRKSIERLHPGHGKELEKPIYVNWGLVPYADGGWISSYGKLQSQWDNDKPAIGNGPLKQNWQLAMTQTGYRTLLEPEGPIYFAGDHVTTSLAGRRVRRSAVCASCHKLPIA